MKTRFLYMAIVTPLGMLGRPFWRRRLGLGFERDDASYWRRRDPETVTKDALRRAP